MLDEVSSSRALLSRLSAKDAVLATAGLLVVLQTVLRAWALYPSWYYTDDYRLLYDARASDLDLDYLTTPFDSQFMPLGRAAAWLVAVPGDGSWPVAATMTLGVQFLASVACVWMLVSLFGARWAILAPLAIYLSSALLMPATMWWAASLNQLPLQLVCFAAVTTWVSYLRGRRWPWLVATLLLLAVGLTAYVKTVLIFGVLAYLVLAYFATGSIRERIRSSIRHYWVAVVSAGALGAAFGAYYLTQVPQVFQDESTDASELADAMIGRSLTSGLVGGPWRWDAANPPVAWADPPTLMLNAASALVALTLAVLAVVRSRTGRAWLLLGLYTASAYLLLLTSRAPIAGALIGLEFRYLTDVLPVGVLCLALAAMPLRGAAESSTRRKVALIELSALERPAAVVISTALALVCAGGAWSSIKYAQVWHDQNPGADYTRTAADGLSGRDAVDLADQIVPGSVMPGFSSPYNTTKRLLPLLVDNAQFPEATSSLVVLDDGGRPHSAVIDPAATSGPGPVPNCGWRVGSKPVTVPLRSTAFDFTWWVRIGYLSSADVDTTITIADQDHDVAVRQGVHNLFIRTTAEVSEIVVDPLPAGTVMCIDSVEVGNPAPGGAL